MSQQQKGRGLSFLFGVVAGGVLLGGVGLASPYIPVERTENMKLADFQTRLVTDKGVSIDITSVRMRDADGDIHEFDARDADVDALDLGQAMVTGRGFGVTYSQPLSNLAGFTHQTPKLKGMALL
jgi:hypothetical protein